MINKNSDYIASLPEQYFNVPKGQGDSDALMCLLDRMDAVTSLIQTGTEEEREMVCFILEGYIYQAKCITAELDE